MTSEGNENVVTKDEVEAVASSEDTATNDESQAQEAAGNTVEEDATATKEVVNSESDETVANDSSDSEVVSEEVVSGAAQEESKPKNPDLRWYVVNAYSGYESKVKVALGERIRSNGMEDLFGEIQVPQETVVELVKGQKKTSNRKFFPGYVLVEMILNEDTWHLIKETPKVSGFVGDKTSPMPLEEDEVKRILNQVEEGAASPASKIKFEEGETVKVTDGPFSDFNGTVEEVNQQKGKLKVLISIFGRATPVELDFIQVEKLQKV